MDVPLILWLQGGPGSPLGTAVFTYNGPLKVVNDSSGQLKAILRNETWNLQFALLYIESPVGTGFSFTRNESTGYATTLPEVSRDLLEALGQFFTLFSEYRGNPLFLAGQSYSGKYIPSLATAIHRLGKAEALDKFGINLKGFSIGNGFCDPIRQLNFGDFLFSMSLIDRKQRDQLRERDVRLRQSIQNQNQSVFLKELKEETYLFVSQTGLKQLWNILDDNPPKGMDIWKEYVALEAIKSALHLGSKHPLKTYHLAKKMLLGEMMVSVKAEVEELLKAGYRALFYAGNLDIVVAAPLVEDFLYSLNFTAVNSQKLYDAEQIIYKVNSESDSKVAGYVKQLDNLLYVVVRNAGHMVLYDQPKVALDMVTRFVKELSFGGK